jgi:hypothetical protein
MKVGLSSYAKNGDKVLENKVLRRIFRLSKGDDGENCIIIVINCTIYLKLG